MSITQTISLTWILILILLLILVLILVHIILCILILIGNLFLISLTTVTLTRRCLREWPAPEARPGSTSDTDWVSEAVPGTTSDTDWVSEALPGSTSDTQSVSEERTGKRGAGGRGSRHPTKLPPGKNSVRGPGLEASYRSN